MIWHRLKLVLVGGTAAVVLILAGGTVALLRSTDDVARSTAQAGLQRSAQSIENTLNRHLLQVDGALASLPGIFAAVHPAGEKTTAAEAAQLLRELNFQTSAFRDLMLIGPDGKSWAAARSRIRDAATAETLSDMPSRLTIGAGAVLGPSRNRVTGDWALYLARPVELPGIGQLFAVAEIPNLVLVKLLSENTLEPGTRVQVERADGQLLASIPANEPQIGKRQDPAPGSLRETGTVFETVGPTGASSVLSIIRPTLYGDIFVVLSIDTQVALAGWLRNRSWIVIAIGITLALIIASAAALFFAIKQRERLDLERSRAATILESAIEAMSDGFVMWDADDRLVTCNRRYLDLYSVSESFLVPGAKFEDIVRRGAEIGQYPEAEGRIEEFVKETVAWHRAGLGTMERLLPDGRWLLITERPMADNGAVGIRTDITVLKQALRELAAANERETRAAEEARQQNAALRDRDRALEFLAHHDELTKLPNRVLFRQLLTDLLNGVASAGGDRLALLYLDLDRFKDVNDTQGHPIGDALLKQVAGRLLDHAGERHLVFRLGGDEFAVICLSSSQPDAAEALSARLIGAIEQPYVIGGLCVNIGASIGIALASGGDADELLKNADLALYRAKALGRGTQCLFAPEMATGLQAKMDMESDLRLALERGEFEIVYQPIYDLVSDRACGLEALLRWRHPTKGLVSPGEFIPVAEQTGLIAEIGAWVLRRACHDVAPLPNGLKVAVNLSPVQLTSEGLVTTVAEALSLSGLEPSRLELEITETALIGNDRTTIEHLDALHGLGLSIVLDDFGTGYSSLSHLRNFPLSKIKIDQSFVREMTTRADSSAIVRSVTQLAERLGMNTTAEGVETPEQLERVREAGCTQAQGYLLGRPQPILAAVASLAGRVPQARTRANTATPVAGAIT